MILGTVWSSKTVTSGGSGYTSIICCSSGSKDSGLEYDSTTSTGSYSPTFSLQSSSATWGEIGDAIQAATLAATPSTFQQLVTWNPSTYSSYEASDLGNVRFCLNAGCSPPTNQLNAWLESCTPSCSPSATSAYAWVKLTSAIPAGTSVTIDMVFEGTSVDFDASYWGEAPNLSTTYAANDNGANVFNAYFNGITPNSSFSVASGYGLTPSTPVTYTSGSISAQKLTGYGTANAGLCI